MRLILIILISVLLYSKSDERWKNTPAEIKDISFVGNDTILSLDLLSLNPDFKPGQNSYFLNKNKKIRRIKISGKTKVLNCGLGKDENETTADIEIPINEFINNLKGSLSVKDGVVIYYFDIENNVANCIYEQCLP